MKYLFILTCILFLSLQETNAQGPTIQEIDNLIQEKNVNSSERISLSVQELISVDSVSRKISYTSGVIYANINLAKNLRGNNVGQMKKYLDVLDSIYAIDEYAFSELNKIEYLTCKGYFQSIMGDSKGALTFYLKSDSISTAMGDPVAKGITNFYLASYHADKNEYESAINYSLNSANSFKELHDTLNYAILCVNIARFHKHINNLDSVLYYCNLAMIGGQSHPLLSSQIHKMMSDVFLAKKDYDQAKIMADKVKATLEPEQYDFSTLKASYYMLLGNIHYETGQLDLALYNYTNCLEIADSLNWISAQSNAHERIIKTKLWMHGQQDLIANLETYKTLNDSVFRTSSIEVEKRLVVQYETVEKEKEISKLRETELISKRKNLIATFSIVTLILILILIISWNVYRKKISKQRLENIQLSKQMIQSKLQNSLERIKEKNMTIYELKNELSSYETNEKNLQQISKLLSESYIEETKWNEVLYHFDQLNNNFTKKVSDKYENLTKNEIKLLVLIQIGYLSKEIALVRNVSEAAVKKAKQRLLKKMNLLSFSDLKMNKEYAQTEK